jgi:hypothetical protein
MTDSNGVDEKPKFNPEESNLVSHAREEMRLASIDEDDQKNLMALVEVFDSQRHSGGAAGWTLNTLVRLLQYENLTALTDDPEEWNLVSDDHSFVNGPLHQNRRNPEAFSVDGGKTYYLLSENPNPQRPENIRTSNDHLKRG